METKEEVEESSDTNEPLQKTKKGAMTTREPENLNKIIKSSKFKNFKKKGMPMAEEMSINSPSLEKISLRGGHQTSRLRLSKKKDISFYLRD